MNKSQLVILECDETQIDAENYDAAVDTVKAAFSDSIAEVILLPPGVCYRVTVTLPASTYPAYINRE